MNKSLSFLPLESSWFASSKKMCYQRLHPPLWAFCITDLHDLLHAPIWIPITCVISLLLSMCSCTSSEADVCLSEEITKPCREPYVRSGKIVLNTHPSMIVLLSHSLTCISNQQRGSFRGGQASVFHTVFHRDLSKLCLPIEDITVSSRFFLLFPAGSSSCTSSRRKTRLPISQNHFHWRVRLWRPHWRVRLWRPHWRVRLHFPRIDSSV